MKVLRMWVHDEESGFTCLECAIKVQKEELDAVENKPWDPRYESHELQKKFARNFYSTLYYILPAIITKVICDEGDNLMAFQCPKCDQVWKVVPE